MIRIDPQSQFGTGRGCAWIIGVGMTGVGLLAILALREGSSHLGLVAVIPMFGVGVAIMLMLMVSFLWRRFK